MKYIPIKICLVIVSLFGGIAGASDLPDCPKNVWHNCFGTYNFPSGNKYVGEFKDGELSGQGTFTWADGANYDGGWKDSKKTGQGTQVYSNGDKYGGEWKDGRRNGQGTLISAASTVKEGIWKDDKFLGTIADLERARKQRIAKEKQEKLKRQKQERQRIAKEKQEKLKRQKQERQEELERQKHEKHRKIFHACIVDKSSSVDMQVGSVENAVLETCNAIANEPSWFDSLKYN